MGERKKGGAFILTMTDVYHAAIVGANAAMFSNPGTGAEMAVRDLANSDTGKLIHRKFNELKGHIINRSNESSC